MNLPKAALISTFGRGRGRPKLTAARRLTLCSLAAIGIGVFLAIQVPGGMTMSQYAKPGLAFAFIACLEAALVVALLISAGLERAANDSLPRLLTVLPVKPHVARICLQLSQTVLCLWCLALIAPALSRVFAQLGLPYSLSIPSIVISLVCASGASLAFTAGVHKIVSLAICLSVVAQLFLAKSILLSGITPVSATGSVIIILLLGLCSVCIMLHTPGLNRITAPMPFLRLPQEFWLLKKMARSARFHFSFLVTLSLSGVIAAWSLRQHGTPELYLTAATLLATALASDIRGLSRRLNPPEIVILKGTYSYSYSSLLWGMVATSLSTLPLLVVSYPEGILEVCTSLALGTVIGWFAGVVIVPGARDITGQFTATCLAGLALFAFPYATSGLHASSAQQHILKLCLCSLFALVGYAIEYKRNPYYWRSHA